MTDRSFEELRAELRQFEREQRDRKLRRGRAYPRTARESEIWLAGIAKRGRKRADDETPPECEGQ